ncbi:MAG: endolytic transglycosylase MltG [Tenuifilaceae bacterium]|nr:endolytic transglycosylase MltG [Tenuifilaceae bacterium]
MSKKIVRISLFFLLTLILGGIILGGFYGYKTYSRMLKPNVSVGDNTQAFVRIPTGATYADVLVIFSESGFINDMESFKWTSSRMGYPHSIRPGMYKLQDKQTNRELVAVLRAGLQTPVRVTFTGFRVPSQLAGRISKQIEADSAAIVEAFFSKDITASYGFTPETFIAMFIPNTYELFWNTDATGFFDRMKREYENFWTDERDQKAKQIGLDRVGVSTIASIVEEETIKTDERPKIAGVFINRLNRGTPLQACPTVKFALGDFTIKRVLTKHLAVESPYNTYKHRGLPPGPINAASISSINAVLNYEKHSYYFFSANPDFSGYHIFSRTLTEHNRNARVYQGKLNKERIYR